MTHREDVDHTGTRLSVIARFVVPLVVLSACGSAVVGGAASEGGPSTAATSTTAATHGDSHSQSATSVQKVESVTDPLASGGSLVTVGFANGPYTPTAEAGGTDDYHCFLIDPAITTDTFLTGVRFMPGNASIVHHAILFRVPPDSVAAARAKDAQTPDEGWSCFGDTGIPATSGDPLASLNNAPWLSAWAPGGTETLFARGTGVAMPSGTQVVLQMHYNLLAGNGPDSSGATLRLAKPGTKLTPLETMLLPAPVELPCAVGQTGRLCDRDAAILDVTSRFGRGAFETVGRLQLLCGGDAVAPKEGPTQVCDRYITNPITVVAAAGHMHLLGRSIRIDKVSGDGTVTNLIDKPVWDFDNQSSKVLPKPVTFQRGERLRVTCTHDATLRDTIPSLQDLPDRYVVWGEGTSDEMCLGIVTVLGTT